MGEIPSVSEDARDPADVDPDELTRLLRSWADGREEAFDRLLNLVYDDLKAIAHGRLRHERPDHPLQTTVLVHEAYMRLVSAGGTGWRDRAHFFAVASRVIRHILVDYARAASAVKRGGDRRRVTLTSWLSPVREETLEVLALEEALRELARHSPRMERVVECRFFGGMTVEETADVLNVSPRTVEREWRRARAYLYRRLGPADDAS